MEKASCPNCDESIIKSYGDEYKLRSKLLKWNSKGMFAVCKSCGEEVPVHSEIFKALQNTFRFEVDKII